MVLEVKLIILRDRVKEYIPNCYDSDVVTNEGFAIPGFLVGAVEIERSNHVAT